MPKVTFNSEECKACGLCVNACPKKILQLSDKLNEKGYRVAECKDESQCIGCAFCATMCPDVVITVYR